MIWERPPKELVIDQSLSLRKLTVDHALMIYQAISSDREHLRVWLPFIDDTRKPEDTETFIKSVLHSQSPRKDLLYEIWYEEEFAGLIALKEVDIWNKKTELGYWLLSKFERKGMITRSCEALIDFAFRQLGMYRIQLKAAVGNARSCMVAERLNFKREGIERSGELHHKHYFDLVVYSLLRDEWKPAEE